MIALLRKLFARVASWFEPEVEPPRPARPDRMVVEGIERIVDRFPHCDSRVLHRPEGCEYCAMPEFAVLHEWRRVYGINYTGENDPAKWQCPAEARRPIETINRWPGNRPEGWGG